jgi:hypothetical protein
MTRKSAKSMIRSGVVVNKDYINSLKNADDVVDAIFDYFEQKRTCRTCGWFDGEDCNMDGMMGVPKIIGKSGCGAWEAEG